MGNGLLFPGQGSQAVGMGKGLYHALPEAKRILDEANDILGFDLKTLMFDGPQGKLTDTEYAQPAIYTCSAMYFEKVKADGLEYSCAAGHSLGEYNALLAAGIFSFPDGLKLVAKRGAAMGQMNGKGTMAAVMGMEEDELGKLVSVVPGVAIANLNSRAQIVISGPEDSIDAVGKKLSVREDIKFKKLRVSAAFHSPQMEEAAKVMKAEIEPLTFHSPGCSVISNVTGKAARDTNEIKENLISQITGQVRWHDTVMAMKEAGIKTLYEVGHGDVLKKLNRTITFRPKCIGVGC